MKRPATKSKSKNTELKQTTLIAHNGSSQAFHMQSRKVTSGAGETMIKSGRAGQGTLLKTAVPQLGHKFMGTRNGGSP